ncbi:ABC transporter permease [Roseomonas haemaphysalidis]|jgi:lipopolysaccharide transport system permease protein|uniref:ABC transporter permease n=1 Tax=Roseomonas haemaphysalidis TaxID=2768162 RepID=A0ABS3KSV4_9PROT|nr:ABC transporter permease [Roseomonas haemaphysalidis]MBO1080030.1 ABC transporter permease [Roseomonas haemaphysalidis]
MQTAALSTYHTDARNPQRGARALADLVRGFSSWRLAWALARLDLRNRYRGSVIGPFWVTLSTAVMVVGLGLLYSQLLKQDITTYLPHLAVSLIVWNTIAALVPDATTCLSSAEGVIRQLPLPLTTHALRCVFRNAVAAAHSLPLIVVVFLAMGHMPGVEAFLAIPGLLLLALNAFAASIFLGMICARFRDIGQIVTNVMQLAFFMTPVIWRVELLGENAWRLLLNPFYPMLEVIRGPLVDGGVGGDVWIAALAYTAVHCGIALAFFIRFRARVAFWV